MYALYRMALISMTFSDLEQLQSTPFSIFCIAFRIFLVGGVREFEFGS